MPLRLLAGSQVRCSFATSVTYPISPALVPLVEDRSAMWLVGRKRLSYPNVSVSTGAPDGPYSRTIASPCTS